MSQTIFVVYILVFTIIGGEIRTEILLAGGNPLVANGPHTNHPLVARRQENTTQIVNIDRNVVQRGTRFKRNEYFHEHKPKKHPTKRLPFIDVYHSPNVSGVVGEDTHLNCRVHRLGNNTVSWLRHGGIYLLSVGRYTYTSDLRFESLYNPQTSDWTLRLRNPVLEDSGEYECQVSTSPHLSHSVHLTVREPETELLGGPDLVAELNSTINLTCTIKYTRDYPESVTWWKGESSISHLGPRPGVTLITDKDDITVVSLVIAQVGYADTGNYTCSPDNAPSASINLHIIKGSKLGEWSGSARVCGGFLTELHRLLILHHILLRHKLFL